MTLWSLYREKKAGLRALKKFQLAVENAKRRASGEEPILTKRQRLKRFFSTVYPPFKEKLEGNNLYERIFKHGTRENAICRLLRNIVLIEAFGIIMYFVLAFKYAKNPGQTGTFVSILVHFFLSLMFVFPTVMYYFMLSTHRMLSSKIRTLILVIIVSVAFEVPAMNVLSNVHRVAEGVACVQNDVMTSAKAIDENVAKKGEFAVSMMQQMVMKLAKPVNFFKQQLSKFDRKVSRVLESIKQTWRHLSNLTNQCKRMMRGPYLVCLNTFHDAYVTCLRSGRAIGIDKCSAIQKANKMCEIGKSVGDSVCNFPSKVKGGISDGALPFYKKFWGTVLKAVKKAHYFQLKAVKWGLNKGKKVKQEVSNLKTLGLKVESNRGKDSSIKQLKDSVKASLTSIIDSYKRTVSLISLILHWTFIPIALFWPFFSTALFMYKFNYREEYRNEYLTSTFDQIDTDCALRGNTKVLPLSKKEKETFIRRSAWKMTSPERREYRMTVAMTSIAMATPILFMIMDTAVYTVLFGVYEIFSRTRIEFPSHYELKVSGDGYGASILNTLLETFSPITNGIKERDEKWRECFEEPTPPNYGTYVIMVLLFIVCLILCRTKVWLARQSLSLADYFFPHRVRPRALLLYTRILAQRKNIMAAMIGAQRATLVDDVLAGREGLVRRGMQSRGFVRVRCSDCGKTDLRVADEANTRLCIHCGAFFCVNCFSLSLECIDCEEEMQTIDGIDLYFEEKSDDEEGESETEKGETTTAATEVSKDAVPSLTEKKPSTELRRAISL